MRTDWFDYELPPERIAQQPAPRRDASRLLVLTRPSGQLAHHRIGELPDFLRAGDVLVVNNSRVIPARLWAVNRQTGTTFEILLLEEQAPNEWWAMLRPGKKARPNTQLWLQDRHGGLSAVRATVIGRNDEGHRCLRFEGAANLLDALAELGEVPLPPYIQRQRGADLTADETRYQTVYAAVNGSVAAPTAGLHFTDELLGRLQAKGVEICEVTLHVGLATFAPVKAEHIAEHPMHEERYTFSAETAAIINRAKAEARRIVAVGTTSMRVLESVAARASGPLAAGSGTTRLFIHPPYSFRVVDVLLTNFHLPRSTLLMLVCAFAAPGSLAGRDLVLAAYAEAIRHRYRFFSYGDAMLLGSDLRI